MTDVPHFTESYYRARKSLAFYSGLLLAYEFIGVEVGMKPLSSFDVTIISPDAIPYILGVLAIFYLFRYHIEWRQCSAKRRELPQSTVDFYINNILFLSAFSVTVIQILIKTQIFEMIKSKDSSSDLLHTTFSITVFVVGVFPFLLKRGSIMSFIQSIADSLGVGPKGGIFILLFLLSLPTIMFALMGWSLNKWVSAGLIGIVFMVHIINSAVRTNDNKKRLDEIFKNNT